jgi:ankyrin repeat protein
MTLKSIIDPKKRARVQEALRRGDPSLLKKTKKPSTKPLVEEPSSQEKLNQELLKAAFHGDIQKVNDLLHKGAEVNTKDNDGATALMLVSIEGHTQTAALLIQNNAEVNTRDNNFRTPLMRASTNGKTQTAELLIQNKADVNARTKNGITPLKCACASGHTQIAELLRKHGAKE